MCILARSTAVFCPSVPSNGVPSNRVLPPGQPTGQVKHQRTAIHENAHQTLAASTLSTRVSLLPPNAAPLSPYCRPTVALLSIHAHCRSIVAHCRATGRSLLTALSHRQWVAAPAGRAATGCWSSEWSMVAGVTVITQGDQLSARRSRAVPVPRPLPRQVGCHSPPLQPTQLSAKQHAGPASKISSSPWAWISTAAVYLLI